MKGRISHAQGLAPEPWAHGVGGPHSRVRVRHRPGARGEHGEDRCDLSAERQCRFGRAGVAEGDRGRRGHRQQRAPRSQGPAARPERRPDGAGRGEGGCDLRRPAGQPSGRAERRAAPDHPGPGERADRLLPVELHADRERGRRALRHPLRGRRIERAQPHRARLQMVLPHHPDRHQFRRGVRSVPGGPGEAGASGPQRRDRQREHRLRHLHGRRDRGWAEAVPG